MVLVLFFELHSCGIGRAVGIGEVLHNLTLSGNLAGDVGMVGVALQADKDDMGFSLLDTGEVESADTVALSFALINDFLGSERDDDLTLVILKGQGRQPLPLKNFDSFIVKLPLSQFVGAFCFDIVSDKITLGRGSSHQFADTVIIIHKSEATTHTNICELGKVKQTFCQIIGGSGNVFFDEVGAVVVHCSQHFFGKVFIRNQVVLLTPPSIVGNIVPISKVMRGVLSHMLRNGGEVSVLNLVGGSTKPLEVVGIDPVGNVLQLLTKL